MVPLSHARLHEAGPGGPPMHAWRTCRPCLLQPHAATLRASGGGAGVALEVVKAWREAASDEKANSSMRLY